MLSSSSSRRGRSVFLCGRAFVRYQLRQKQKSLHGGGFKRDFSFLFFAHKPRYSGAKVKKETENSSIHACDTLYRKNGWGFS
jgi:hypothetical protein